ncbi:alginate export family protein [Olivibacter sp. CPCC 100613]|uniref:alginate export family protein n=1 Tax=Olivibacter sp. CPCC 100613 TaxID=3079931 RepID=UPI002FF44AED
MKLKTVLLIGLSILVKFSYAQNFKLLRFNEDYSALKDSTRTFYNSLKYLPLSESGKAYVSFGGELRAELDRAQHEDWGANNVGSNIFLLQRYQLHADLHLSDRIRIFGQLRSGLENGRKNGPRPIDEDQLNVQNLFIDLIPYKGMDDKMTIRLGRQELQYGSGRLLDVREGPNLRLYFDGAKVAYTSPRWNVDAFVMAAGRVKTGVFDNATISRKSNLWGVYSTHTAAKMLNIDLYYMGIHRDEARFDDGVATESRHTIGTRLWANGNELLYNFEIGYQLGKFGKADIRAWGGSMDIAYRFTNLNGVPTIKLRSDFISGDGTKDDGKLGTFNALYPNGGYFGMNPQAGPANLLSIHPNLSWNPVEQVLLSFETVFSWRQSLHDGIYLPDGTLRLSSSNSDSRYIGTAYISTVSWQISKFLSYNAGLQYFKTGDFINDVIPQHKDGVFISSLLGFKF